MTANIMEKNLWNGRILFLYTESTKENNLFFQLYDFCNLYK